MGVRCGWGGGGPECGGSEMTTAPAQRVQPSCGLAVEGSLVSSWTPSLLEQPSNGLLMGSLSLVYRNWQGFARIHTVGDIESYVRGLDSKPDYRRFFCAKALKKFLRDLPTELD